MENLTPPVLEATRELRWRVASGISMKEAVRLYLTHATTPFAQKVREWWALKIQDRPTNERERSFSTHYQRALLDLIARGVSGQPTLEHLQELEDEIEKAAHAELEMHLATLSFKVLIPLLVFQFPAYLILLVGPLLRDLSQQMGR